MIAEKITILDIITGYLTDSRPTAFNQGFSAAAVISSLSEMFLIPFSSSHPQIISHLNSCSFLL